MTDEQKKQIRMLRSAGYGYATLADKLGLTKNQVSAFCRRNNLTGIQATEKRKIVPSSDICKGCGKPIKQIPGKKQVIFCSDSCRMKWWNAHPELIRRNAIYEFTCAYCGKTFFAYGNAHRKYCSHVCYIRDRFKGGDDHE